MEPTPDQIRILWASPLPPTHSGVADFAAELLPELARRAAVRVLRPPGWDPPHDWPSEIETVGANTPALQGEIPLLHLGNNPHHLWLLQRLHDSGAVVVLHDAVLHHLLVESVSQGGGDCDFEAPLVTAHGDAGRALAAARRASHHGRLDGFVFPARAPFLEGVAGVITHSRVAAQAVEAERPDLRVRCVPLAAADPGPVDRAAIRKRLGVGDHQVLLMHLGFLTPEKGLEEILMGFSTAVRTGIDACIVMVGEGAGAENMRQAAAALGLQKRMVLTGWIEQDVFLQAPGAADLGVVYRTPSAGETSAAVLRFLACGVPVAVGGRRQFLEWPEPAAPRLTPGAPAAADLARLLGTVGSPEWDDRRQAARAFYERSHRPEHVAGEIVNALLSIVAA